MTVSANGVLIVTNFYDAKSRRVKKAAFAGLVEGLFLRGFAVLCRSDAIFDGGLS